MVKKLFKGNTLNQVKDFMAYQSNNLLKTPPAQGLRRLTLVQSLQWKDKQQQLSDKLQAIVGKLG